jgi:hypothetical protein
LDGLVITQRCKNKKFFKILRRTFTHRHRLFGLKPLTPKFSLKILWDSPLVKPPMGVKVSTELQEARSSS